MTNPFDVYGDERKKFAENGWFQKFFAYLCIDLKQ